MFWTKVFIPEAALITDEETKDAVRRAYLDDPKLSSAEIGKAFGRSRQSVNNYLLDLRANLQEKLNLKLCRMHRLGIPQDRIASRLDIARETVRDQLADPAILPKRPNNDLKSGVKLK